MLQDPTLALKTDNHKHEGFKQSKDGVTLLLCQTGNCKLFSLQKHIYKQIHLYGHLFVHTPMNIHLLVHIFSTFI